MNSHHSTCWTTRLLLLVMMGLMPVGCISFHSNEALDVLVLDAETGEPLPGALVEVEYSRGGLQLNAPRNRSRQTDANGRASIVVAAGELATPLWYVSAEGYIKYYRLASGNQRVPWNLVAEQHDGSATTVKVRLYREPDPTVTLIVPDGYVGPLFIRTVEVDGYVLGAPGQRDFEYTVSDDGYVEMEVSPLLFLSGGMPLRTRYMSGRMIPPASGFGATRLYRVFSLGSKRLWVIGTEDDQIEWRNRILPPGANSPLERLNTEVWDSLFDARQSVQTAPFAAQVPGER